MATRSPSPSRGRRVRMQVRLFGAAGERGGFTVLLGPERGVVACEVIYQVGDVVDVEVLLDGVHSAGIKLVGRVASIVRQKSAGDTPVGVALMWREAAAQTDRLALENVLRHVLGLASTHIREDGVAPWKHVHRFEAVDLDRSAASRLSKALEGAIARPTASMARRDTVEDHDARVEYTSARRPDPRPVEEAPALAAPAAAEPIRPSVPGRRAAEHRTTGRSQGDVAPVAREEVGLPSTRRLSTVFAEQEAGPETSASGGGSPWSLHES